jgi:hypothetical protein
MNRFATLLAGALAVPLLLHAQAGGSLGPVQGLGEHLRILAPPTGPVPRLPDGTVDLNGLWVGGGPNTDIEREGGLKPGQLVSLLLPPARAIFERRQSNRTDDPTLWCLPFGVPRASVYPFRFLQNFTHKSATHIYMLQEGNIHSYRQIFVDGRKHPQDLDPTWFGHSIGQWENDTLVIDTVGYNDKFWFDRRGFPHSEQLHTIERWTRVDEGHMTNRVTIDDPGAYARPWDAAFNAQLAPAGDEILEYICQENNQLGVAGGFTNPYAR